jgi:hypothetical protein
MICRLVLPSPRLGDLGLLGAASDRTYRNRLQVRWLARQCAAWLEATAEVRTAPGTVLQSTLMVGSAAPGPQRAITGTCSFTTEGLGIAPSTNISLIQVAESAAECALLSRWFTALWSMLPVAIFFAARAARHATAPIDRAAAVSAAAAILVYAVHCYGDMGLGTWASVCTAGPALAFAGRLALSCQVQRRGARRDLREANGSPARQS